MDASTLDSLHQCFDVIPLDDRRSKIGPREFVITLACAFFRDAKERTLASLRRNVIDATGKTLSRGSFWERLATQKLTEMLLLIVTGLISSLSDVQVDVGNLAKKLGVSDILLIDSSSTSLPKGARKKFPAPRNNVCPASVKWHLCLGLLSGFVRWFEITKATTHDSNCFPPLQILKGTLAIFDLGYWDYSLLRTMVENEIFFFRESRATPASSLLKPLLAFQKNMRAEGFTTGSVIKRSRRLSIWSANLEKSTAIPFGRESLAFGM